MGKTPSLSTYIREARPDELKDAAGVLARAFVTDPAMHWFSEAKVPIKLPRPDDKKVPKSFKTLYYFHHSLLVTTSLSGGHILVVVDKDRANDQGKEDILAMSMWFPPGKKPDAPLVVLKSKQYRAMFGTWKYPGGWGLLGLVVRELFPVVIGLYY